MMFSRFDAILACNGQTNGRTDGHIIIIIIIIIIIKQENNEWRIVKD